MKDSGVVAKSTYNASSQPSNTYTINNHRWNHGTEVINTVTPTEKEGHGGKTGTSWESDSTASPVAISRPVWALQWICQSRVCKLLWVHPPRAQWVNFLYQFQEFFLSRPSGRRICISRPTDLDIITSEREITLVEQLALRAICCTSAPFMAVCGPETRSALRSLQAADLFRSGYLNLISLQRVLMVPSCSLDRLPWNAVWWNEVGRSCQDAQERKKVLRVEIKNVEIRRGQIYSSRVHSYLCSVS